MLLLIFIQTKASDGSSSNNTPKILLFHLKQLDSFYVLNWGVLLYYDVRGAKQKINFKK